MIACALGFELLAGTLGAVPPATPSASTSLTWMAILALMAILPFILVIITPFAKLVIVGGLLRSALGSPQTPPNTVITGLALILTLYVMFPVITRIKTNIDAHPTASAEAEKSSSHWDEARVRRLLMADAAPLYEFMLANTRPSHVDLFDSMAAEMKERAGDTLSSPAPATDVPAILRLEQELRIVAEKQSDWNHLLRALAVLAPAFILTELTEALQMAFFIFVPFVVIDLFVTNILLAIGMQQMTPTTISLPLKLLVFVLMDGWSLLIQNILLGYHYRFADLVTAVSGGAP
jgi:type III secretion protein R